MSTESCTRTLVAAPEPGGLISYEGGVILATSAHEMCSSCFGAGMEVVMGKASER